MKKVYAVLAYPPVGRPRVIEMPAMPKGMRYPVSVFKNREKADKALEKFLTDNPEYQRWCDGSIRDE